MTDKETTPAGIVIGNGRYASLKTVNVSGYDRGIEIGKDQPANSEMEVILDEVKVDRVAPTIKEPWHKGLTLKVALMAIPRFLMWLLAWLLALIGIKI